jgi:hypothetical protein
VAFEAVFSEAFSMIRADDEQHAILDAEQHQPLEQLSDAMIHPAYRAVVDVGVLA